ncbi:MAG: hypothetical protein LBS27_00880 [Bifidobacteriaceae bacterium]|nr:hypothetical protein [Bifidobacteriaceae bacterium]
MVEVMIAVLLLSVFSIAAVMAITGGTAASSDNRARITAAGLAQRELDYSGEVIASGSNGANLLRDPVLYPPVNPNLPASMDTGDANYAFGVDGQRYKVERSVTTYVTQVNSPCDSGSGATQTAEGTVVTVTVSWEGASAATRPHVASKVFPPHPNAVSGLTTGQSQIAVVVKGDDQNGTGPRQGVVVEVSGPQVLSPREVTNINGCAVFKVVPGSSAGSLYTVTLIGYQGGGSYVFTNGQVQPHIDVTVLPDETKLVPFNGYSQAGSITVRVLNAPISVQIVDLRPQDPNAGGPRSAYLVGGAALFGDLPPGYYSIEIGGVSKGTANVAPGLNPPVDVTL